MNGLKIVIGIGLLGWAGLASASWAPSHYRCSHDQLDPTRAEGRQKWALRCATENPYNRAGGRDSRFWSLLYSAESKDAKDKYNIWLYPVYVDPDNAYDPWRGPGGSAAESGLSAEQIMNTNCRLKPIQILQDGICEPGCYTPDQTVLFEQGPIPIASAQEKGLTDVMTLAPEASFPRLALFKNSVLYYTLDPKPVKQKILTFRMASGGNLSVTTEHALVTDSGSLQKAREFRIGDHLVRKDGTADEIVDIESMDWTGRTYNLKPTTTDLISNILVAQGYLSGSGRFQSEYVEELNRLLIRHNLPDSLVPRGCTDSTD